MTDQPYDASYQGDRPHPGYEGYQGHDGHRGDESRESYEGYDPHARRQPQPQPSHQQQAHQQQAYQQQAQQAWPGQQQGYDDPQAHLQHTQQWQGQTWETSVQRPVTAADPSRTPAPARDDDGPAYGNPHAPYGDPQPAYGDRSPSYGDSQSPYGDDPQSGYGNGPAYGVAAARTDPSGYGVTPAHDGAFAYGGDTGHGRGPAHDHGQGQDHRQDHGQGQGQGQGHASAYGVTSAAAPLPPEYGSAGAAPQTPAPRQEAPAPAADSPTSGPTYGPATLAGNARVTDAQRARLEGRSPIIEPGMQPAALTALLGLLLSGTAAIGSYALVVPLVALQAVTAAGWFRLNGMWPARQGIALAFLGALVSDVVLLATGREHAPAAILGTLGVWVLLCLVLQLRSHADPDERMYGLMATVASSALAVLATGHLGAEPDAVTVGAAAVAVAVLARALPLPTPASVAVALLAAAGAGIAVGRMTGLGAGGALLGAGAAVCALIGHRVASYDYPSRFVHFTAGVALPLAAAAPAVYVLGRVLA